MQKWSLHESIPEADKCRPKEEPHLDVSKNDYLESFRTKTRKLLRIEIEITTRIGPKQRQRAVAVC